MDEDAINNMTNHLLLLRYNGLSMITYLVHYLGVHQYKKLPSITPSDFSVVTMVVNDYRHRTAFSRFAQVLNENFNLPQLNEKVGRELEKRGTWTHLMKLCQSEEEIINSSNAERNANTALTL